MSLIKSQVANVAAIAREVAALADGIIGEIDRKQTYEHNGERYEMVDAYPHGPAPDGATHTGYALSSAALKRRSMDLTRALATMRKGDLR